MTPELKRTLSLATWADVCRWWRVYLLDELSARPKYKGGPWRVGMFADEIKRRVLAGEAPLPLPDDVALLLMEVSE